MPRSLMDRMGSIGRAVGDRLDRIPGLLGEIAQPQLPLPDYLLQAQEYAAQDAEFADQLAQAVQQYTAVMQAASVMQEQAHAR